MARSAVAEVAGRCRGDLRRRSVARSRQAAAGAVPHRHGQGSDGRQGPVRLAEERLLGIDHQEAGGLIADKWNLKPLVRAVITHHHFKACPQAHRHAIAVVRLADYAASTSGNGAGNLEAHSQFLADRRRGTRAGGMGRDASRGLRSGASGVGGLLATSHRGASPRPPTVARRSSCSRRWARRAPFGEMDGLTMKATDPANQATAATLMSSSAAVDSPA